MVPLRASRALVQEEVDRPRAGTLGLGHVLRCKQAESLREVAGLARPLPVDWGSQEGSWSKGPAVIGQWPIQGLRHRDYLIKLESRVRQKACCRTEAQDQDRKNKEHDWGPSVTFSGRAEPQQVQPQPPPPCYRSLFIQHSFVGCESICKC